MSVGFSQVPANARVPMFYAEFSSERAGAATAQFSSLLVGQRLAAGTVAAGVLTSIGTAEAAAQAFGAGSMLANMAAEFRRQNPSGDLWAIAVDDAAGATAQTMTVTVNTGASAAGTVALYVYGRRIPVGVSSGASANSIATSIAAAINAVTSLPATAGAAGAVVTITARHGGASMDLDVRTNYHAGETLPAGVTLTIADGVAGATDPSFTTTFARIGAEKFGVIAWPYAAAAQIGALEVELTDRWGPVRQLDGVAFSAYRGPNGTQAEATTYGNLRNSQYDSVMDVGHAPSPTWQWSAAIAGAVALSAENDPARPFQTLQLKGILGAQPDQRRDFVENNTLLWDGMSTHSVAADGTVRIQRLVTTYQHNASNEPDEAWLSVNTPLTLSWLRNDLRSYFVTNYPRHKLADDGTAFDEGQPVMTPKIGRAEAVARFEYWEGRGLVENAKQFAADLVVARNTENRDRLDFGVSPDLVNAFLVGAALITFIR